MLTQLSRIRGGRGFSMIELMVGIAIVAVIAALAAPSFKALVANAQIRTAAQALHDGLKLARVEAIRRNQRVTFVKAAGAGWTVSVDSPLEVVQTRSAGEGSAAATVASTPAGGTEVSFNSLGRVIDPGAAATITRLDVSVPTSVLAPTLAKNLRITVSSGGAIRLCDPAAPAGVGMGC